MAELLNPWDKGYIQPDLVDPVFYEVAAAAGIQADILRLDKLHPIISGNKGLKLKHWLQLAKHTGASGILTKGGPWSNHLHAAGLACTQAGLRMKAVIKAPDGLQNPMIKDLLDWGAGIEYVNRKRYYEELHWQEYANSHGYLYIPMGGEGPEGAEGVSAYFNQLSVIPYDYLMVAIGTATTLLGIAGSAFPVKSIIGIDPGTGDAALHHRMAAMEWPGNNRTVRVDNSRAGKGFGRTDTALLQFMLEFYRQTNIPTDIVYTAKMTLIFNDMCLSGALGSGSRVLLVHTGGLQGNRSVAGLPDDFYGKTPRHFITHKSL